MKDLITAIGLLFFIEGLIIALFPSKIKNMLKVIEKTPENKLRISGVFFFLWGVSTRGELAASSENMNRPREKARGECWVYRLWRKPAGC